MSIDSVAVEQLLAREQIKEAKHKYFRAIDYKQFELLEEVLTDDVAINYGPMGQFKGRKAFMQTVAPLNKDYDHGFGAATGIHHALNPEIQFLENGEARCHWFSYFLSYDSRRHSYLQQSGHYSDLYRCERGRWKICVSNYTLWFHQASSVGVWTPLFPNRPDGERV